MKKSEVRTQLTKSKVIRLEEKGSQQFHLPDGWVWTNVRELSSLVTKGSTPTSYGFSYVIEGINFVKVENIMNGRISRQSIKEFVTEPTHDFLKRSQLAENDILFSIAGTIGRVGMVNKEDLPANINQAIALVRCPWQFVNPQYLKAFLESPLAQSMIRKRPRGVAMNNVGLEDVKNISVPLPPFAEQRRIVAKVEALFAESKIAREALDKVPVLLQRFRQSVLSKAFKGELTNRETDDEPALELVNRAKRQKSNESIPPRASRRRSPIGPRESTNPAKLPEGWAWVRFEDVAFAQNGRSFPSKFYTDKGIRLLRPGNLHISGRVVWTPENTRYLPESFFDRYPDFYVGDNQIIMNLTAQSLKDGFLGRVCMTDRGTHCLLNQRQARIRTTEAIDARYLFWVLKSPIFRNFVRGLESGTLIQHMFTWQINEFIFPLAPLKEQKKVVKRIEECLSYADEAEKATEVALDRVKRIDQSVLAKTFRGELVPQDPNDEPASVLLQRIKTTSRQ